MLNLWRVPAIVRDMVHPARAGSIAGARTLISAAWIGLIAGYLLPRFAGFVNSIGSETFEGYVRNLVIIQLLSLVLVLTGSVFLVVLIWWIEGRILRRQTCVVGGRTGGLAAAGDRARRWRQPQGRSHGRVGLGRAANFTTTAPAVPPLGRGRTERRIRRPVARSPP